MISIARHINTLDEAEVRTRVVAQTCAIFAGVIEKISELVGITPSKPLQEGLISVRLSAANQPALEVLEKNKATIEKEAENLLREVVLSAGRKEQEYKSIIKILADATTSFSQNSVERSDQLKQLVSGIEDASRLNNIIQLRKQLSQRLLELKTMASDMEREGQTRVVNLEKQIKAITERLVTAETTAETDPLTGLANRRRLEREVQNAILSGKSFSLLLFDMDGFKQVNDTYGHNSGDQLLKAVSSGLKDSVRGGDIACRWGGDEFAVLLPNCRLEDAGKLADRIRISTFGEFMLECSGKQVRVNVGASRGIAEYQAGESAEQLLERADKMLYDHKKERHEKRRAAAAVSA